MPKRLTAEQVQDYESRGFACPVPVLTPAEVRDARAAIEAFEARTGRTLDYPEKSKSYLLFDWADRLIRHPAILDAVEDLIGPDILVYHTTMWIKDPGTPQYIAWHQDGTYFYLDPAEHVTAWVALSDASEEAGCMRVLPGTHRDDWHRHDDDTSPNNLILRGQAIYGQFEGEQGVPMPLKAGEMSLHHTKLVHCSHPNAATDRRMGFGISYIPTRVRDVGETPGSAMLVRGEDRFRHFAAEERVGAELSPEAYANHERLMKRFRARQDAAARITKTVEYAAMR
ncbi:MAG: phytanoyl-CoA dioxygenase family protein [Alphaproteobacteria bacterium]|nr:phytanoyl-CoA dioxygenase family protein [Alphaproteobacteria bacterium]MCB9930682.1 phytanoyl-CoA dioxygenase family protein [Alphaproteobacteria bacterium]